ncbi:uncharacterized protein N0V96_009228 [Colletotrichum fioriniae]|uniref:uncharacterized protein n=1 Tax=Colletotrichum fioriniae TaxID=710243 RepID=UPI0032D9CC80|nr:hypothetical protein N0V96_009228 [Colletotrichum fioriniae]
MAANAEGQSAKTAHVNMMTDTIITNLPAENLRVIMRSLLATHPDITTTFEAETRTYVRDVALPLESISLMTRVVRGGIKLLVDPETTKEETTAVLASVDGDIVQIMTAVEKRLLAAARENLQDDERDAVTNLHEALIECRAIIEEKELEYPYTRALFATSMLLGVPLPVFDMPSIGSSGLGASLPGSVDAKELFEMNSFRLPRLFTGLWQMSSPSWGSAPTSKIIAQFSKHMEAGLTAFDMADHYGDAEIIFGRFRSSYPFSDLTFAATKYCVFNPMTVTRAAVQANVAERCRRLQTDKLDLLQFHWQFYEDPQYVKALRFLEEDPRVKTLGLCNFDTEHMQVAIDRGIKIHSNQVQFSLIDSRPEVRMGKVCQEHNIKLLTYGTLCGGFLAEKWLGKGQPDLYDEAITPSQRKYYAMIRSWGGWDLFQDLLKVLKTVASRYGVSVSNVATRWVLDFPYVGAVIVGTRMGISERADENLASLGWSLSQEDREFIEDVLKRSRRLEMFEAMGDCGGEYR